MASVTQLRKRVKWRYGSAFDFCLRIVRSNRALAEKEYPCSTEVAVILYHFAKGINLLDAVRRLCQDGYAREAIPVARSLFNLYINLRWLTQGNKQKDRIEKFADFEALTKANNCLALIRYDKTLSTSEKKVLRRKHRARIKEVEKKYNVKKTKSGKYPNWNPSIASMAEQTGLEADYRLTYARLSQTEHTDPESVREYLPEPTGDRVKAVVGPDETHTPVVLIDAIRYFLNIKRDAASILDFKISDEEEKSLGVMQKRYSKAIATV